MIRPVSAVPRQLRRYLCLDDFEPAARRIMPKFLYGYVSGGAEHDAALRDNRKALDEYGFVPRVLNDVSAPRIEGSLLGGKVAEFAHQFFQASFLTLARLGDRNANVWHERTPPGGIIGQWRIW